MTPKMIAKLQCTMYGLKARLTAPLDHLVYVITKKYQKYLHLDQPLYSMYEVWIEIKYSLFLNPFYRATARWRVAHSPKLTLYSHAYFDTDGKMCWDDVEIRDRWGLWVPGGFTINSKAYWDFEKKQAEEHGWDWPEEPKFGPCIEGGRIVHGEYFFMQDEYLLPKHYLIAGKKHLSEIYGRDAIREKDWDLELSFVSDAWIQKQAADYAVWEAQGKPPFKIEWTDRAKDSIEKITGEDFRDIIKEENDDQDPKEE